MTDRELREFYERLEEVSDAFLAIQSLGVESQSDAQAVARALNPANRELSRLVAVFYPHAYKRISLISPKPGQV
jgi:hypothetical protein